MLTQETKRKIDSARQILVGKVPDPKAQVEQITIALIYKFMDDMDKEAIELGGKARFFSNGFQKYAWTKLLDSKLGGHERLELYGEAVARMSQNPHIPQLFRDIFKDAFLPYRSPETLTLFLKEINGFTYDHSEDLGNAFEYLLSILGSQGDAGQFRTPRHIIDFIVDVVEPKKGDTILDPACGTAGFLISAYKNILKQQKDKPLTPDEKKKLMNNLVGYDISPDMVKLSKVNLYLHGFAEPKIFEYDTLSSEEKWDETFNVIMANPPFMSPSGGIRPHRRFSVQANRAEVLFVDYIKEHLRPKGRAGIIVPEGVIFKNDLAYKQLRKLLVEDGLYAIVSLPAGVFNPYSGVKTSILFFDNELTKRTKEILFVRVLNDGFDLGAQRRKIERDDLPFALDVLKAQKISIETGNPNGLLQENSLFAWTASKEDIAKNGDYNFSGDRYGRASHLEREKGNYPMVELGELAEVFTDGNWIESKDQSSSGIRIIQTGNIGIGNYIDKKAERARFISEETFQRLDCTEIFSGDVLVSRLPDPVGRACIVPNLKTRMVTAVDCTIIRFRKEKILPEYFIAISKSDSYLSKLSQYLTGSSRRRISRSNLAKVMIPLPPLEVQKEIVAQIEVKQSAIEHAKAIIEDLEREREYSSRSLRKEGEVKWVELGEICDLEYGFTDKAREKGEARFIRITDIDESGKLKATEQKFINLTEESRKYLLKKDDVLVARTGATYGKTVIFNESYPAVFASYLIKLSFDKAKILPHFYWLFAQGGEYWEQAKSLMTGGGQQQFNGNAVKKIKVPIVPILTQKKLIKETEKEEEIIATNRRLIEMMEKKIALVLGRI